MLSVFYVPSLSGTLQLAAAGLCSTWYNGYLVAAVLGWVLVSDAVIITMHFADRAWVRAPSRMCCNLLHPLFFSLECHCTNVRYIYIYIYVIYMYIYFFLYSVCVSCSQPSYRAWQSEALTEPQFYVWSLGGAMAFSLPRWQQKPWQRECLMLIGRRQSWGPCAWVGGSIFWWSRFCLCVQTGCGEWDTQYLRDNPSRNYYNK